GGGPLLGITEVLGGLEFLLVGGSVTSPRKREVVGCLWSLLIDLSRFGKGPHQRTEPSPLLDRLRGPFPVRVVAILTTLRGAGAETAMEAAALSAANGGALARCAGPGPGVAPRCFTQRLQQASLVHGVDLRFFLPPPRGHPLWRRSIMKHL